MDSEERALIEALERRIAALEDALRASGVSQRFDHSAPPAPPASESLPNAAMRMAVEPPTPPPNVEHQRAPVPSGRFGSSYDLESLVGRYGTLVLATVSALAAVGTFLGWAIANGLLGPSQRIALGLITAAALAVGGLRLRRRERSFGASLLGLALAIIHVCAWGAGPSLHLVPSWAAFLLAALASIALAAFAHAEDDEPLWSVGFSGAAVAPFVTASGKANLLWLAAYGVAVLASAGFAMGPRRWIVAGRLFLLAALIYTAALATGFETQSGPLLAMGFPLTVAIAGVIPWSRGWPRRERLRAMGALATLAAVRSGMGMNLPYDRPTVTAVIVAAGILWLALVDQTHAVSDAPESPQRRLYEGDWLDAALVPLGFVVGALAALDASAHGSGIAMVVAAIVLLFTVIRFPEGTMRDAAVFASVVCALIAVLLLHRGKPLQITAIIAVLSAVCFVANIVWRSATWTTLGMLGFVWAALACVGHLMARPAYQYTPFATQASAVSAVVLASLLVAWRSAGAREPKLEITTRVGAAAWAFLWVHQEIAFAVNPTVATLLRVTYYAGTSVVAVGLGRARRVASLRHIGLALAVLAAATALYNARKLEAIGARIGADLVAAVFLLAIAYWYRRPGTRDRSS